MSSRVLWQSWGRGVRRLEVGLGPTGRIRAEAVVYVGARAALRALSDWPALEALSRGRSDRPVAYLAHLEVDPDWRGRGLARRVLSTASAVLDAGGVAETVLLAAPQEPGGDPARLVALYRSAGFVPVRGEAPEILRRPRLEIRP